MKMIRTLRITSLLLMSSVFLLHGFGNGIQADGKRSDVPMTRPEEALVVIENFGGKASFVKLPDGNILAARRGGFSVSKDGGLTWSDPVKFHDVTGQPLLTNNANLVRLSGNGIGYSFRVAPPKDSAPENIEDFEHPVFSRSEDGRTEGKPGRSPCA